MESPWIWEPPAPWERQFLISVGHTPKSLDLHNVFQARTYMHVRGIHRFKDCPERFGGSTPRLTPEELYQSFLIAEYKREIQLEEADTRTRLRVISPTPEFHYCGPDLSFVDDGAREDPEWRSFATYEDQWQREFPPRYRASTHF